MRTCKEVTRLVSEGLDRELPLRQRLGLRLHVLMCRGCARFARQIRTLNRLIADHFADGLPAEHTEHVSPATVQHIKSSLRRATPDAKNKNEK